MKKRRLVDYAYFAGRLAVFAVCGFISLFLVLSGYESIFNRDLPFVHTLDTVDLSAISKRYNLQKAVENTNPDVFGNFGKPQTLKLPERAMRLDITAPIIEGADRWLARANTLHYIVLKDPRRGNIGLLGLYCRASFRTIDATSLPKQGENIFIDTDKDWRYIYRVSTAKVIPEDQEYVVADDGETSRLVIVCNDAALKADIVVEAVALSVQGVTQQ